MKNTFTFNAYRTEEGKIRFTKTSIETGKTYEIGMFDTNNLLKNYVIATHCCSLDEIKRHPAN